MVWSHLALWSWKIWHHFVCVCHQTPNLQHSWHSHIFLDSKIVEEYGDSYFWWLEETSAYITFRIFEWLQMPMYNGTVREFSQPVSCCSRRAADHVHINQRGLHGCTVLLDFICSGGSDKACLQDALLACRWAWVGLYLLLVFDLCFCYTVNIATPFLENAIILL